VPNAKKKTRLHVHRQRLNVASPAVALRQLP
jgi:hypothetical protein